MVVRKREGEHKGSRAEEEEEEDEEKREEERGRRTTAGAGMHGLGVC